MVSHAVISPPLSGALGALSIVNVTAVRVKLTQPDVSLTASA